MNTAPNTVSVLLGNGDGTFQSPITSDTTADPSFVVVGYFNSDKIPDIAIVDPPYISVLLGNGDGTFQAPSDNESFVGPQQIAVGDFNNDHKLDVVVVGFFGGSQDVGVLLGNGDGTLQSSLTYPLTYTPNSVVAADFNHDGNLDAAIGDELDGITVLIGTGDGSFQPGVLYATHGGGGEIATRDLNGDGKLDLVLSGANPPGLNELLGNGDGTFRPETYYSAGRFSGALAIGDFNGDHQPDIAYSDRGLGAITLLNTGALSFSPSTPLGFPAAQLVGTASAPVIVTLTNGGTTAVSVQSVAASGQFEAHSGCGNQIAAGAHCTVSAAFEPRLPAPTGAC